MSKDKKIAMLMLCHILPNQINDFIDRLDDGHFDFFIHVDKKSDIKAGIKKRNSVHFVPDEKRTDVRWGQYSMVEATLQLIELATKTDQYDYYWLCSGQDFPIRRTDEICEFLKNKNCNFMSLYSSANNSKNGQKNTERDKRCEIYYPYWLIGKTIPQRVVKKLYNIATGGTGHTFKLIRRTPPANLKLFFGSQWWCLSNEAMGWILEFIKNNNEVCDFFRKTLVPDESFFQTLFMNSPYAENVEPNLVYMDWSEGKNSPKVLTIEDWDAIKESKKLLARKIDYSLDGYLYEKLILIR